MRQIKFTFLLVVVLSMFSFAACRNEDDNNESEDKEYALAKDIVNQMQQSMSLPDMTGMGMEDEGAQDTFEYLCDIDYSLVEDFYISYASDATAQEILVIRLKSDNDAAENEKYLEERIERRKNQFMQYKPEELPVINGAVVERKGPYLALIINDSTDAAVEIFNNSVK